MSIFTKAAMTIARGLGLSDPRIYRFLSIGGPTYAGESVTVDTALQLDVVWACVRLIAQTIATLPLLLYQRNADGHGSVDRKHPLYRLLHDRPNSDMTATEFWEAIAAGVLLWGNAYGAVERIGTRVVAITPMRPDRVTIVRQEDGSLLYRHQLGAVLTEYTEDQIFHVKGFSLDGLIGISPIAQARQVLATAIATEKTAGTFFRNGMRPSAVMLAPTYLTPNQRADADAFLERYTGAINAGKVPLLEGGWTLKEMQLPPEDAQLLATRSFQVEQICRWFDVPPAMIGHMDKSTSWGTGLEQMTLWFLTFSLRHHLKRIEQAISKSLLSLVEQGTHYAEFNVEGLLRADSKGRSELYAVLARNGLRTRNELRAYDNLPPLPDGDDLTVEVGLIPVQLLGKVAKTVHEAPLDPGFKPPAAVPTSKEGVSATTQ
jgi:HK97 family phage portal protein